MEYLVTAQEMKQYDTNTIERIGIPGMVLMERAALAAFSVIEDFFAQNKGCSKSVLIMAGTGNNGGDGLALARLLSEAEYEVSIRYIGNVSKASEQWKMQKAILEHFCVRTGSKEDAAEYTIMVDALFGVGLSRDIKGEYAQAIQCFNQAKGYKLALDIPSGICADTGRVLGCAVKAHTTVTFGFCKRGLMLYPGAEYAGEVITAPIGITEKSFFGNVPGMFCYKEDAQKLRPKRDGSGNKGSFGKVLLVAGNNRMAGAAILSAKAAYRSGAGMVKVITYEENRMIMQTAVAEALFGTPEELQTAMEWADVIAIGPGLGVGEQAKMLLTQVIRESRLPLVIDADGLNLLAEDTGLWKELASQGKAGRFVVLTPHVGELARLMKQPVSVLKQNLAEYGVQLASMLHAVVVAKDARTVICRESGPVCLNIYGNSGMATAGSGDVLTGVIVALLAQGMNAFDAAGIGVYLHARAGDRVAKEVGEYACMAGDIIRKL